MAQQGAIYVANYQQLLRDFKQLDTHTRRELRAAFRQVGDIVRVRAAQILARKSPRSAAGFKVRVRQRGIAVEQSIRKTSGIHPEWGAYQVRHALVPALYDSQEETAVELEHALDVATGAFNL